MLITLSAGAEASPQAFSLLPLSDFSSTRADSSYRIDNDYSRGAANNGASDFSALLDAATEANAVREEASEKAASKTVDQSYDKEKTDVTHKNEEIKARQDSAAKAKPEKADPKTSDAEPAASPTAPLSEADADKLVSLADNSYRAENKRAAVPEKTDKNNVDNHPKSEPDYLAGAAYSAKTVTLREVDKKNEEAKRGAVKSEAIALSVKESAARSVTDIARREEVLSDIAIAMKAADKSEGGEKGLKGRTGKEASREQNNELSRQTSAQETLGKRKADEPLKGSLAKSVKSLTLDDSDTKSALKENSDTKQRDRRKERINVQLQDQRGGEVSSPRQSEKLAQPKAAEVELVVRLEAHNPENSGEGDKSELATGLTRRFTRELQENTQADIIKQAQILLKNNGEGLIRLRLEPESLGAVKIRLQLTDNKIRGRIEVESSQALRAFEQELRSLEKAFIDGGFDGAGLELAISANAGDGKRGQESDDAASLEALKLAAEDYDAAVPDAVVSEAAWYDSAVINVFA